jgi:DnaJ-class molecular chaperone
VETFKLTGQAYEIFFDREKRKIYNVNLGRRFEYDPWIMNSVFSGFKFSDPHDVFKHASKV